MYKRGLQLQSYTWRSWRHQIWSLLIQMVCLIFGHISLNLNLFWTNQRKGRPEDQLSLFDRLCFQIAFWRGKQPRWEFCLWAEEGSCGYLRFGWSLCKRVFCNLSVQNKSPKEDFEAQMVGGIRRSHCQLGVADPPGPTRSRQGSISWRRPRVWRVLCGSLSRCLSEES